MLGESNTVRTVDFISLLSCIVYCLPNPMGNYKNIF